MNNVTVIDWDEIHHQKIVNHPFSALMHAHDYLMRQTGEWPLNIRLGTGKLICQKALEVHIDDQLKKRSFDNRTINDLRTPRH